MSARQHAALRRWFAVALLPLTTIPFIVAAPAYLGQGSGRAQLACQVAPEAPCKIGPAAAIVPLARSVSSLRRDQVAGSHRRAAAGRIHVSRHGALTHRTALRRRARSQKARQAARRTLPRRASTRTRSRANRRS
jgi:hypothetical protein